MCRLLIGGRESIIRYNKKYDIKRLLVHLVEELGGNGNGLVLIENKRIIYNKKGLFYSINEISNKLLNTNYEYCLFHTRLASIGEVSDKNCHPFIFKNNCIAMNGTMPEYIEYTIKNNITDTEYFFNKIKTIKSVHKVINILQKKTPTFIGSVNGIPYIVKNINSVKQWKLNKDDILFASSFTNNEDVGEVEDILDSNFYWYKED